MGLFGWLKGRASSVPLPQLCYDVAYFILPHYAYRDFAKITDLCLNTPHAAGPFFYVMACVSRKIEPVIEDGKRFTWHHGELTAGRKYFILEYPSPPPLDLSEVPIDEMIGGKSPIVLAPYFSAVLRNESGGETNYYVLGQAPIGGGTTLRHLSADGVNSNLGPGSAPQLTDFLAAIRGA